MENRLYILRHAHASDAETDEQRPLSEKGAQQMQRLCGGLAERNLVYCDAIWHSHLKRAAQTASLFAEGLGLECPLVEKAGLAPFDDPIGIATLIEETNGNTLVVGHEPNLSGLASLLLAENRNFERVVFSKASILCLARTKSAVRKDPWMIEWHVSHRIYR